MAHTAHTAGPGSHRKLVLRVGGIAAMGGAALVLAASSASAANAGTLELDNWSPPFVTNNNHPHLNCSFAAQLFGFDMGTDKGNTAQLTFTGQAPTGKDVPIPITLGPSGSFSFPDAHAAPDAGKIVNAPRGTGWAEHFELDTSVLGAPQPNQGFHVSIDAVVNGATLKQKTVWVQPCGAPPGPNVGVEKSGPADGIPGDKGTYDVTATNDGDGDALNQTITDTLPAGETFVSATGATCTATNVAGGGQSVSCPIGTLAAHSSKAVHVVVAYDASLADLTQLTDCATVTGSLDNPCVTTTLHTPKIHLTKVGPATGLAGGQGTYDLVATNSGSADATSQTITDTLPAGETFVSATGATCTATNIAGGGQSVSCPIGTLTAGGGSKTVHVVVAYGATVADNTPLKDCATVTGSTDNPCVTTTVRTPKVHLTKVGPATGLAGGQGTYDLVATNSGSADATSQTITDTLPAGETFVSATGATCTATNIAGGGQSVSCPIGTLTAGGGSKTVHVVVAYGATVADNTPLKDCATVTGSTDNPCVTTVVHKPSVTVVKSGPPVGLLNDNGTYSLVATNNGGAASTATTFTDTLPAGETFVAAQSSNKCSAVGQLVTCQLGALDAKGGVHDSESFTVVVSYTAIGDLTDCATINGQANPSCVTTHVTQPNLQVRKTGPATGTLSGGGVYTILATNNGGADSTATTFTDTLPDGEAFVSSTGPGNCSAVGQVVTCQLGALAKNGGSATYTVTVTYTKTGNLTDCATIAGQPVPSCVTTHIPGAPSISVIKTNDANGDGVFHDTEAANNPGDAVTFRVVVTNTSTEPIALDTITDAFDSTTLAECPNLINLVLNSGEAASCTFTIANYAPAAGTSLTDTVTVGGHQVPGGTPVGGSDTSTVNTKQPPTPGLPDLAIVKTADQTRVRAGDTLTYTLAVSNVGAASTTGAITVTDSVPAGLDLVSVDGGSAWDCSANGRDITCVYLLGVLNPGSTAAQITVVTTVNDAAVGSLVNTGVVATPGDDNPTNDRSTVKTPVIKVLGTKIVKTPTPTKTPTAVLPFTGDRTGQMLPVGLTAVLFGLMLMVAGRRRRRTSIA